MLKQVSGLVIQGSSVVRNVALRPDVEAASERRAAMRSAIENEIAHPRSAQDVA